MKKIAASTCALVLFSSATYAQTTRTTTNNAEIRPFRIYYKQVDKGGHYPAWEQPELFASELRAAFESLRNTQ